MRLQVLFSPILALTLVSPFSLFAQAPVFKVDTNHTVFGFKASTVLFDVPGRFDRYTAEIEGDPSTLQDMKIHIEIDAGSINTNIVQRDNHLRSPDFFDVAKFPTILFTSTKARKEGDKVIVRGTLTIHGVSKELDIPFQGAQGLYGAGVPTWSYRATISLNRLDFGLGAQSVAAKISLVDQVELNLLLVGSFDHFSPAPAAVKKP